MIVTEDLAKRFGDRIAVDGVSLTVEAGAIFGLIGPDGAGKTTLFRMLAAVLEPTAGTARIGGIDIRAAPEKVRVRTGYMPQAFSLYADLTVDENLAFVAEVYEVPREAIARRTERLLAFSRLGPFRRRLAEHLSGGMKQKLALACTLIHEPAVLLLDEPTTGVDPVSRREFWQVLYGLNREGMTVVVATPYMDEAERCSQIALIHEGRILSVDTPARLRERMQGTVVEVTASPLRPALTAARDLPGVLGGSVFGASLHVVVTDPARIPLVRAGLEERGIRVTTIEAIEPSLEDVFVSLMTRVDPDVA